VGDQLLEQLDYCYACDVFRSIIDNNRSRYRQSNVEFLCLDAAKDELPKADVIVIRQVLQHLSNNEIAKIVAKLRNYQYAVITEHLPSNGFQANKDKIIGPDSRLRFNSGVIITEAPFDFTPKESSVLCEVFDNTDAGGVIQTILYRNS